jgi:hypothetical protein
MKVDEKERLEKINENTFKIYKTRNEKFLKDSYEKYLKLKKEYCKDNITFFDIPFEIFTLFMWKKDLYLKPDEISGWGLNDGVLSFSFEIAQFVSEYASNYVAIGSKEHLEIQKMFSYKDLYKTSYLIYCSMLGVENYYFEKMYEKISESNFYMSLTKNQKSELEKLMDKFKKFEPESKSNEDLIKSFFKTAIKINDIPTLDQLESSFCSRSKWQRKLKELDFLYKLNYECEKRLKKKLTEKNKNLLVRIKNEILDKLKKVGLSESSKTGVTKKTKPNFDETFYDNENDYEYQS